MTLLTDFEKKWTQGQIFELAERDALTHLCAHAKPYADWCETLLAETKRNKSEVSVNLALLQLQAHYWQRYATAPKSHRNHIGTRSKHSCLFQVYRRYYQELRELHLDVNPPQLREEKPPYRPAPPQIAGVPFGILEDDAGAE